MKAVRLSFLLLLAGLASHADAEPVRDKKLVAELVSEARSIAPGKPFTVAVHVKHDPGWHTYWKNPGLAGVPISINWKLPDGFAAGPIQWPPPERLKMTVYNVYGFHDEQFLLVEITPPKKLATGEKVTLEARPYWMMCSKTRCLPPEGDPPVLALTLPVAGKAAVNAPMKAAFDRVRGRLPKTSDAWRLTATRSAKKDAIILTGTPDEHASAKLGAGEVHFYSEDGLIDSHEDQKMFLESGMGAFRMVLPVSEFGPKNPMRLKGVLHSKTSWLAKEPLNWLSVDIPLGTAR